MGKMVFLTVAALLCSQMSFAGPMADKKKWDEQNASLEEAVKGMADAQYCGGRVKASFNQASFKTDEAFRVASQCNHAVGGIGTFCYSKDKAEKAEVLKAVKSITCHFNPNIKVDDKHPHALKIDKKDKSTHIDITFGPDVSTVEDDMKAYLAEKL
ncbi:MAG: hypothetical protein AB7O96_10510 [Pseudobdellovibrionaceae bacterium]